MSTSAATNEPTLKSVTFAFANEVTDEKALVQNKRCDIAISDRSKSRSSTVSNYSFYVTLSSDLKPPENTNWKLLHPGRYGVTVPHIDALLIELHEMYGKIELAR